MGNKYVAIIQCDIAHNRCSGYACTESFYNREGMFENYEDGVRYISFTCGGCCGKSVSAKLEHFAAKCKKYGDIAKEDVTIHLASCMVTDHHHYDRCPHLDYIRDIVRKKGYENVVEGSYIRKAAAFRREKGIYKVY